MCNLYYLNFGIIKYAKEYIDYKEILNSRHTVCCFGEYDFFIDELFEGRFNKNF